MASFGEKAITPLVKALRNEKSASRQGAVLTLGMMDEKALGALPDLIESLKNGDPSFRRRVIEAIGEIGPSAKDAVPALIDCLKDSALRDSAITALGNIGDARALGPNFKLFGYFIAITIICMLNKLSRLTR